MPAIILGIWALFIIGICVWAGATQVSDQTLATEGEPDWSEQSENVIGRRTG